MGSVVNKTYINPNIFKSSIKWLTIKPKVSLTWYKKVTGCNFY